MCIEYGGGNGCGLGMFASRVFVEPYSAVLCALSSCEQDGFHRDDGRRGLGCAGYLSLKASLPVPDPGYSEAHGARA